MPPAKSRNAFQNRTLLWGIALLGVFLFRLFFGLGTDIGFIDQHQIYLIGLKFYTTGAWPYFGPDVAPQIQLPGALQGLAVGLPFFLLPIPEAPYLALAILSFVGLGLFAWVCCRRLPSFPRWIIGGWLLTAPWVLNWSTNIDNDSYALFGGCVFFAGFLEALPAFRLGLWPLPLSFFMMGFSLFWCAQFHMSYVLLFPFAAAALFLNLKNKAARWPAGLGALALGCLSTGLFMLPTYLKYGFALGSGGMGSAVSFNPSNALGFFTVLGRFLSLSAFEIPRFIGSHTADRLAFLGQHPWMIPFAVVLFVSWIFQIGWMALAFFQKRKADPRWNAVRLLTALTVLGIYLSFIFAIKTPAAHTYYITLPLAMFYAFYCFKPWVERRWFSPLAAGLLACNLLFHFGLALHNYKTKSLYQNRVLFQEAIQQKNYHLLGERRDHTLY
jgi:hypothetical protein